MTTTEGFILRELLSDLAEMLDIPATSSTTATIRVAVKRLVDERHAARGTMSARTRRHLADLATLDGWTRLGVVAAQDVWDAQEQGEFPETIAGGALADLVERELQRRHVPETLLGPITAERLEAFRAGFAEEWRATADVDALNAEDDAGA